MGRHLLRLLFTSASFYFLLPLIPGVQFHGSFLHALLAGILFTVFAWVVELAAMTVSATLLIATLGMALFILAPLWLLGFFLLPAIALRLVADTIPSVIWFSGWWPAIWSGLVVLFIGVTTSGDIHVRMRRNGPAAQI
jgi:hypothetical protein